MNDKGILVLFFKEFAILFTFWTQYDHPKPNYKRLELLTSYDAMMNL